MVCWEGIFFSFFRLRRAWSRKLFLLLLPPSRGRGWGLRGAGGFSLGLFVLLLWAVDVRGDSSPHRRVPASQEVGVPLCVWVAVGALSFLDACEEVGLGV